MQQPARDCASPASVDTPRSRNGLPRTVFTPFKFLVAFATLLACDLSLRIGGFRGLRAVTSLARTFPQRSVPLCRATQLALLVDKASAYYYKHTWCLHRAAAKSCFLRLHGVRADAVIGYRPMPFFSHAWVEVDGKVMAENPRVQAVLRVLDRF